jgi:hypothetical protein
VTLREMVTSIPDHVSDCHEFESNEFFKRCAHGDLSAEERTWLMKDSVVSIGNHKINYIGNVPALIRLDPRSGSKFALKLWSRIPKY